MNSRKTFWTRAFAAGTIAVVTACMAHAQSSVTIYGLVDLGLERSFGTQINSRLVSGGEFGSRLGFRGTEDLGGGLSGVFRLETGINADDGSVGQGGRFFGRESSVGLSSRDLGTVNLGRLPTPYYVAQSAVDAFVWMGSGGLLSLTRSGATTTQILPNAVNARHDHAVGYLSPQWMGFEVRALYSMDKDSPTLGTGYGLSVNYRANSLNLVAAFNRQSAGTAGTGAAKAAVVGGSYNFGPALLFAGYTMEKNDCTNCGGAFARPIAVQTTGAGEFRVLNLGTRVPFGAFVAIAQVARIQDRTAYTVNPGSRDANWWAIGGVYALSRRTQLYSSYGTISNRNGSQYVLGTGSAQLPARAAPPTDRSASAINVGLRHTF